MSHRERHLRLRPTLLTTGTLHTACRHQIDGWGRDLPGRVIIILPQGNARMRGCLLAIARRLRERSGSLVVIVEGTAGSGQAELSHKGP